MHVFSLFRCHLPNIALAISQSFLTQDICAYTRMWVHVICVCVRVFVIYVCMCVCVCDMCA